MTRKNLADIRQQLQSSGKLYAEFLRSSDLSVGLYQLPAGATDPQKPHAEDEVYYVLSGRSKMLNGTQEIAVQQGDVIYVAKQIEHRFFDITEDLELLVFFAPPES